MNCSTAVTTLVALDLYQVLPVNTSKLSFGARIWLLPGGLLLDSIIDKQRSQAGEQKAIKSISR